MSQDPTFGGISRNQKATLIIKKKNSQSTLTCHFNPSEYTINRSVSWNASTVIGQDVPEYDFKGGGTTSMSLTLLFDTTQEEQPKDVRDYTKLLWEAAYIDKDNYDAVTKKGEPPHVLFSWGRTWSFEAIITSLSTKFMLFRPDGMPVRAEVTVGLTQVVDDHTFARQNPTSGGIPGKVYTVREGDRLDLIANQYYSKPMLWRFIAEHNDIDNPRELIPGQRLIIPELP